MVGTKCTEWMTEDAVGRFAERCGHAWLSGEPVIFDTQMGAEGHKRNFTVKVEKLLPGAGIVTTAWRTHSLNEEDASIVARLCSDDSLEDIAEDLKCSEKTIRNHRDQLFDYFNVTGRCGLTKEAIRHGIISI